MFEEWKLTDKEVTECVRSGCSVTRVQEAKKRAYVANGGVILNPDAFEDMYEALKGMMEIAEIAMPDTYFKTDSRVNKTRQALAKALSNKNGN